MNIDTYRLEEIKNEIEELRSEAMGIVSASRQLDGGLAHERAYRGWSAQIEKALSSDHDWLGSTTMDTLQETIDTCCEIKSSGSYFKSKDAHY
tara:strand:+ start:158 stop:436 length:279 start_codon:yes stop_codon:yes gene_type:complete